MKHINHGRIALLAKDASGYANLIKLSTEAYRYGADSGEALITIAHLALHQAGLIVLTGGPDGVIDRAIAANDFRFAETALNQLKGIFGDRLYIELQRHGLAQERTIEPLCSTLPTTTICRSSPPMSPTSPAATTLKRMTRSSASPRVAMSASTKGAA